MDFLQKDQLQRGGIYAIRSRNLIVGAYDGERGFVGIREKFGDKYLFKEYLGREHGGEPGFDTVHPVKLLDMVPDGMEIKEYGDLICMTCKENPRPTGKDWPERDECACGTNAETTDQDIRIPMYRPLFDLLVPYEERQEKEWYGDD
jgi:hypothetical protein